MKMKRTKKLASVLLAIVFVFAMAAPVAAAPAVVDPPAGEYIEIMPFSVPTTRITNIWINTPNASGQFVGQGTAVAVPNQPAGQSNVFANVRIPASMSNAGVFRVTVRVDWGNAIRGSIGQPNMFPFGMWNSPWQNVGGISTFSFDVSRQWFDNSANPSFDIVSTNASGGQRGLFMTITR